MRLPRRELLRRLLALVAAAAAARSGPAQDAGATEDDPAPDAAPPVDAARTRYGDDDLSELRLPTRPLGRTGVELPVLALGGFHLGQAQDERAGRALIDTALEQGIRFFDTAEQYQRGDDSRSERWLGAGLADVRDRVFLMTKTHAPATRSAESAREHLEASLERLRCERLDLWQLHAIESREDVDRAFGPGGAMEALFEAREAGRVRFVGVTGHQNPAIHRRALEHFDAGLRFDTVQLPINPVDHHQLSFTLDVLPALVERGLAPLAMKSAASGALLREGLCRIEECLRYVLALPVAALVSGMEEPDQVRRNAAVVRDQAPLGEDAIAALLQRLEPEADLGLEWYKRA